LRKKLNHKEGKVTMNMKKDQSAGEKEYPLSKIYFKWYIKLQLIFTQHHPFTPLPVPLYKEAP